MNPDLVFKTIIESPVGPLLAGVSQGGIVGLYFEGIHRRQPQNTAEWEQAPNGHAQFCKIREQLEEYFAGGRRSFELDLDPSGSPFFLKVWSELCKIPYGETTSYADLAARAGSPRAVRAVGMANARNPISIIVPCHRVVASDGSLTGYAGGIENKRCLLELEGAVDALLI